LLYISATRRYKAERSPLSRATTPAELFYNLANSRWLVITTSG
jgi:hypothetical protein